MITGRIPLGSSRVERVETSVSSTRAVLFDKHSIQPKCMGSTRRKCRVVTWRDKPSGIWATPIRGLKCFKTTFRAII